MWLPYWFSFQLTIVLSMLCATNIQNRYSFHSHRHTTFSFVHSFSILVVYGICFRFCTIFVHVLNFVTVFSLHYLIDIYSLWYGCVVFYSVVVFFRFCVVIRLITYNIFFASCTSYNCWIGILFHFGVFVVLLSLHILT